MTAFLIVMLLLQVSGAYLTLRTKPGAPRKPEASYNVLVIVFCLQCALATWAFLLLLNIWEQGL